MLFKENACGAFDYRVWLRARSLSYSRQLQTRNVALVRLVQYLTYCYHESHYNYMYSYLFTYYNNEMYVHNVKCFLAA